MCQLETVSRLEQAAAQALGCDVEDAVKESYDHYGLKIYSYAHLEYAVGTDEEADQAVKENIKQSLWAFNAEFIIDHAKVGYSDAFVKQLKEMQAKLCEGCNDLVECLIEDLDEFIDDAIGADGRGHFLSSYDGNENEITIDDETFYIYRLN